MFNILIATNIKYCSYAFNILYEYFQILLHLFTFVLRHFIFTNVIRNSNLFYVINFVANETI